MILFLTLACFPQIAPTDTAADTADTADSGSTEETGDETGGGGCVQKGVDDQATDWDLPTGYPANTFVTTGDTDIGTAPTWALADLDGNDRADLVVTRDDAAGVAGLGTTNWLQYSNTGSKFRAASEAWTLTAGFADLNFAAMYDSDGVQPAWTLADLNGDGLNDLVVTRDDTSAVDDLSTTLWLVYANTGSGYSNTPSSWSLPAGYENHTFSALYDDSTADPAWSLSDLDGDGKLDFVITHDDAAGVTGLGTTTWVVHLNIGTGFSATATEWALPGGYPDQTFATIYDSNTAAPTWGITDLDGNGRADMVVTRNDGAGVSGLGTTKWLYYSNTGSRYRAASEEWALPGGYTENTFDALYDMSTESPNWALSDLDRDGKVDLVITRNDSAGIAELGTTRWQLFTNQDAGFADDNTAWPLPDGFADLTFGAVYDQSTEAPNWMLTDLDGDDFLDIVVAKEPAWELYPAKCK